MCATKVLTGKNLTHDCTKRNLLYEIRCLSCEEAELEKIEQVCGDDNEKKIEMKNNMKIPKYVGETSRSAYERGYEHLDKLATLIAVLTC